MSTTVPTLLQHDGDFSQTIIGFPNGPTGTPLYAAIFDPYHISGGVRPQYESVPGAPVGANGLAGGKICSQADISGGTCPAGNENLLLQSALFAHYMSLWPLPNHTPGADGYSNNRLDPIAVTRPTDRFFLRVDHNVTSKQRLNLSISRTHLTNDIPAPWPHGALSNTYDHDVTGSLQYKSVLSPTSILDFHVRFGVAKLYSERLFCSTGRSQCWRFLPQSFEPHDCTEPGGIYRYSGFRIQQRAAYFPERSQSGQLFHGRDIAEEISVLVRGLALLRDKARSAKYFQSPQLQQHRQQPERCDLRRCAG